MSADHQYKPLHYYTMVESAHYGLMVNMLRRDVETRPIRGEFLEDLKKGAITAPNHPDVEEMKKAFEEIARLADTCEPENMIVIEEIAKKFINKK